MGIDGSDAVVDSLLEAAEWILSHPRDRQSSDRSIG